MMQLCVYVCVCVCEGVYQIVCIWGCGRCWWWCVCEGMLVAVCVCVCVCVCVRGCWWLVWGCEGMLVACVWGCWCMACVYFHFIKVFL